MELSNLERGLQGISGRNLRRDDELGIIFLLCFDKNFEEMLY